MARPYFGYSRIGYSRFVLDHDPRVPGTPLGVVDPEQCPTGPLGPCRKESDFYSRWGGVELQTRLDWLGDGRYTTMAGLDGRLRTAAYEFVTFDHLTGESFGSDPALTRWHGGGHDKANEHAVGAYMQQTLEPARFLAFNVGIRGDFDSRVAADQTAKTLSPRFAVVTTPHERVAVKLIYSRAFRAPSFLELNIVNGRLLPNPDGLEPETVDSFEAATTLRLTPVTLTVGAFHANWQDLIELQIIRATAPSVSRYANVPGVRNYGGSLSAEATLLDRRLKVAASVLAARADRRLTAEQRERYAGDPDIGDTVPLSVAPQVYGNASASYAFDRAAVSLAVRYTGRRIADRAFYGGDPSNLSPRPEAPPAVALRAAVTGGILGITGARYLLGADYDFGRHEPYVVGPNQGLPRYLSSARVTPHLSLVSRLTAFAGKQIDLGSGALSSRDALPSDPRAPSAEPAVLPDNEPEGGARLDALVDPPAATGAPPVREPAAAHEEPDVPGGAPGGTEAEASPPPEAPAQEEQP